MPTAQRLDAIFLPKSVAVIGASNKPENAGYAVLHNLKTSGYKGKIWAVNPNRKIVQGLKAVPDIGSISENVDLAVIVIPKQLVLGIVKQCAKKKVKGLVIITAGFQEEGVEGKKLQNEILKVIHKHNIRMMGPNCLGFIKPDYGLNVTFAKTPAVLGSVAFLSQSGALCSAVLDWAQSQNIGFSNFVSVGDMADIGFADYVEYFGQDTKTKSIVIYMESLAKATKFLEVAKKVGRTKPIIVFKSGRTNSGAFAAKSHTGNIAGNDKAFDAAFQSAGILRVDTIQELFDASETLARGIRPNGNRLAIITNAGGPGVISTDMLVSQGGVLAKYSLESQSILNHALGKPLSSSLPNPLDLLGDADADKFELAITTLIKDDENDGILVLVTPQTMTDIPKIAVKIAKVSKKQSKPVLVSLIGDASVKKGVKIIENADIPAYTTPEEAVSSFLIRWRYENLRHIVTTEQIDEIPAYPCDKDGVRKIITNILNANRISLTEPEAKEVLSLYGIPVTHYRIVQSEYQARLAAEAIGYPVVMKIVSPDIFHKTDVGGQIVGITTSRQVHTAYAQIMDNVKKNAPMAWIHGILVESMIKKKFELIVGSKTDPVFGPLVVFGMGGVAVEIFNDTNVSILPITTSRAHRLIKGTKIYKLLAGYRGMDGANIDELIELLERFSQFLTDFPMISEVDMNPVAIDKTSAVVLDAKMVLKK